MALNVSPGPREQAIAAIKAGETDKAIACVEQLYQSFRPLHDRYCDMISLLLTYISRKLGEAAVNEATSFFMHEIYPPVLGQLKGASHEQLVNAMCRIHRAHYTEFHLVEDEAKTTVMITGCNSGGGRLLRDRQPPLARKEGVTTKAWPWSFNRKDFPYYCVHAYFLNEIFRDLGVPVEVKYGRQFDDRGQPINDPCRYIIYKR